MKKQLLTFIVALAFGNVIAQQIASPQWSISQNAAFTQTAAGIRFIDAVDNNVVWAIGYDGSAPNRRYNWFSRTTNGGNSWTTGNVYPDTNTYVLANLEGIDANTAWVSAYLKAGSHQGAIHKTTNGGATWINMTAPGMFTNTAAFTDFVTFENSQVGITVGDPVNNVYEIWRTTNGGLSWTPIPAANIPPPSSPNEFAIVDLYYRLGSNIWFGTNEGRIFRSVDGGLNWTVAQAAAPGATITEIAFTSANNGVLYAFNGGMELWNTTNGGNTWTQITPVPANLGLNDVRGIPGTNQLVSFGAGAGNNIVSYSNNNGLTWVDYGSQNIQYLTGDFANNISGWAGSFSDLTNPAVGGVWKYSGAAITTTAQPVSSFAIPLTLCLSGPTATISTNNNSTGSPAPTYSWSASPAGVVFSSPTASAPTITFNAGNTYTITLLATNATGTNVSQQVITVLPCSLPTVNFTMPFANACSGAIQTPTNSSTGGAPTPNYIWSSNPPANVTFSPSPFALNPTIVFGAAGVYTIDLVGVNPQGSVTASQIVSVTPCLPAVNFTVPVVQCLTEKTFSTTNLSANPTPTTGLGSLTYTWSISPTQGVSVIPGLTAQNMIVSFTSTNPVTYTLTLKAKNNSGIANVVKTISIVDCTSINELGLEGSVSVYPNPANEVIHIVLPSGADNYKAEIANVLGAVVYTDTKVKANNNGEYSINLSDKPAGVYFLTLSAGKEKVTKKIIVE